VRPDRRRLARAAASVLDRLPVGVRIRLELCRALPAEARRCGVEAALRDAAETFPELGAVRTHTVEIRLRLHASWHQQEGHQTDQQSPHASTSMNARLTRSDGSAGEDLGKAIGLRAEGR